MRKVFADKLALLKSSVAEIATKPDQLEELLNKSFSEFEADMGSVIEEVAPEGEPLAKGLNLISSFASALSGLETTINCICEGKPYRYSDDRDREECPEHIQMGLHHFLAIGEMVLREMVNDHVEMPADEEDAEKAHRAGQLHKIAGDDEEILVKSALPSNLVGFALDPALLAADKVAIGREIMESGAEVLRYLDDQGLLSPELAKAIPPEMGSDEEDGEEMASDEPADEDEEGFEDGSGGGDDTADAGGESMDPLEIIVRLASAIMVVGGSLIQQQGGGEGAGDADGTGDMADNDPDDGSEGAEADGGPGAAIHEGDDDGSAKPEGESGQGATDHTADNMHRANASRQSADGPAGSRQMFSAGKKRTPPPAEKGTSEGELAKAVDARFAKMDETLGVLAAGMARLLNAPGAEKAHAGVTFPVSREKDGLGKSGPDLAELAKTNPEAASRQMIRQIISGG